MPLVIRYSQWDGNQLDGAPNVDELLEALSDDFLQHGDISRALRQLVQRGFQWPSGDRLTGLQDLMQRVRDRRQQLLSQHNLGSIYRDLEQRLKDIVARERGTIEERLKQLAEGDQDPDQQSLRDTFNRIAHQNLDALDSLPSDLSDQIQRLRDYEFLDPQAGREFQDLLRSLQKSVVDSFFRQASRALQQMTPESWDRLQQMVRDLNQMLSEHIRGGQPNFQQFMERHGSMFGPSPPNSLEALLQQMQQRMAQAESLLNSLSPDQRDALLDLLSSQWFDDQLQGELAQLAAHLNALSPAGIQSQEYSFFGDESVSLDQAMQLMEQLQALENMERQLGRVRFGASLEEIDKELVKQALGPEAAEELEQMKRLLKQLETAGYLRRQAGGLKLTAQAMRKIGQKVLRDLFEHPRADAFGGHPTSQRGTSPEVSQDTRPYRFGDAFHLDLHRTLRNAIRRGPGVPVHLRVEDFEVQDSEFITATSTVLVLDVSRSMPMRGNFLAAKKVAVALDTLIRSQFPCDALYVVGFSGVAREVNTEDLAKLNVGDFGRGTNVQAGLRVARKLLSKHRASYCQVVLITDGEPTAYLERDGRLSIEYPPGPRVLRETLREVRSCTREGITINTFMLEKSYHLRSFVAQLAKANRGRVLFTAPEHLGRYILLDYVGGRARRRRR